MRALNPLHFRVRLAAQRQTKGCGDNTSEAKLGSIFNSQGGSPCALALVMKTRETKMILMKNFGKRLAPHLVALAIAFGTILTASASDETRREGGKMTEDSQAAQTGQAGASTIEDQKSVAITVYNSNLGLVKDTRTLRLPRGASQLRFMDVAQQINPTTVHIKSTTAPNALEVIEQSYEYDLLNPQKLLDKYVGKELTLVLKTVENNTEKLTPTRAILLSNNNGQVWFDAGFKLARRLRSRGQPERHESRFERMGDDQQQQRRGLSQRRVEAGRGRRASRAGDGADGER